MHKDTDVLHESPRFCVRGAGAYQAPAGRDFPRHSHDVWEWVYYREGDITSTIGGQVYAARPGTLLLTPPQTPHSEEARTAYKNYYVTIEPVTKEASGLCLWPLRVQDDGARTLERIFIALVGEWRGREPGRESMLRLLAGEADILLRRFAEAEAVPPAEEIVRRAERFLEGGGGSITEAARDAGVSPSTLREYFGRLRGLSPAAFRQKARLREATALLLSSDLSLERVAALCGYHSASHLSRHIRKATGKTPGSLRGDPLG